MKNQKKEETKPFSKKTKTHRILAATISLFVGAFLLVFKFWAFNLTNSQAIFSDALESIVNVIVAFLSIFIVNYAIKPVDQDHPYGHGKIEYFSSAFEGGLITFAAFFIMIESLRNYFEGYKIDHIDLGMVVVFFAGGVNFLLGLFLIRMGKKNQSIALRAGGHHVLSDFWTSLGVFLGLVLYYFTGLRWLDSAIAFIVGVYLMITGLRLVKESVGGLMDEENVETLKELAKIFSNNLIDGIIQIHHVKVIRSGPHHHIDAHVVLPEFWTVSESHEKMNLFEKSVIENYEYSGEINFHLDPCRRVYCKVCSLKNCSIRKEAFEERMPILLGHIRSKNEPPIFEK